MGGGDGVSGTGVLIFHVFNSGELATGHTIAGVGTEEFRILLNNHGGVYGGGGVGGGGCGDVWPIT